MQVILSKPISPFIADNCKKWDMRCEPVVAEARTRAALQLVNPTAESPPLKHFAFEVVEGIGDRTFVQYRPEYVGPLSGEKNAALMLSAIVGWYQKNSKGETKLRKQDKNGVWWIAKSYSHWFEELALSRKESTRATEILIKHGIIEVWKYPFDGHACNHYRLLCADGGSVLQGIPSFRELAHVPAGHTAMYPQGTSTCTPGVQLITEIQTKTTTGDTCRDLPPKKPGGTSLHAVATGEAPSGQAVKVKTDPEVKSKAKTPMKFLPAELPKGTQAKSKSVIRAVQALGKNLLPLATLWEKMTNEPEDPDPLMLGEKNAGVIKQIGKSLNERSEDPWELVIFTVTRWQKYRERMAKAPRNMKINQKPTFSQFAAGYEVALLMLKEEKAHNVGWSDSVAHFAIDHTPPVTAPKAVKPVVAEHVVQVPEPADDTPGVDWAAKLKGLLSKQGASE